jgi:alpha-glucosidase (family GH31 glycosyl hydrolase)
MYDSLGIPPGVYLLDRPVLEGNYGFARWEWDEVRLPNPASMLQSLRNRGYRLAIWSSLWTCGSGAGDNGFEAQALGYHVPGPVGPPHCDDLTGTSFVMDPTNPAARTWWRDKVAAFVQTWGIQAIKLDRGEEHIPSEATDVWFDGRTGREVRNDYPRLQALVSGSMVLVQGNGMTSELTTAPRTPVDGGDSTAEPAEPSTTTNIE